MNSLPTLMKHSLASFLAILAVTSLLLSCKKEESTSGGSSSSTVPTGAALDDALQGPPAWDLWGTSQYDFNNPQAPFDPIMSGEEFGITFSSGSYTSTGNIPTELAAAGFTATGTYSVSGTMVRFNTESLGPSVIYIQTDSLVIRAIDPFVDPAQVYDLSFTRTFP